MKLYHAPHTRSVRVIWLLEELGVPYELETMDFVTPKTVFSQKTPAGKFPVLEDEGVTIFESGAIVEYIVERYGEGRLAPPIGSPLRGPYLQWIHFAEATAFPPIGDIVRHSFFKPEEDRIPAVVEDGRERAITTLAVLDRTLTGKQWVLGDEFSAADVMLGYTLHAAKLFGLLEGRFPELRGYVERLEGRPAFQKALEL
jgi:glutathione S-transferase